MKNFSLKNKNNSNKKNNLHKNNVNNSNIKKTISNNSDKKKIIDLENFIPNIKDEYLTKDFSQTEFDNEISFNIDDIQNNNNIITDYSKNFTINNTDFNNNIDNNKNNNNNNINNKNVENNYDNIIVTKIPLSSLELIKDLIKNEPIKKEILKLLKPKLIKKNGKISFKFYSLNSFFIDFLEIFYNHKLKKIIKNPNKLRKIKININKENNNNISSNKITTENNNNNNNNIFSMETIMNTINESMNNTNSNINSKKNNFNRKKIIRSNSSIDPKILSSTTIDNIQSINDTTIKIEKRKSLFPSNKNNNVFQLTKIPQKNSSINNSRLNYAYNKAKDAARVVRRLEYSYSMRISILLSKPMFQKNAKIIQNWWRSLMFIRKNKSKLILIQKYFRANCIRKAYFNSFNIVFKYLPFFKIIDKILSRKKCEIFFNEIIPKFSYLKIYHIIKPKAEKIIKKIKKYLKEQQIIKLTKTNFSVYLNKCVFVKINSNKSKIIKKIMLIQSFIKNFLMHKNEKIMLNYQNNYHPYLYYKLKYGKFLYKKKIVGFKKCVIKLNEFNIKVNKKINNKYDYLNYQIKKIFWKNFKDFYLKNVKESKNNKNIMKKLLLKKVINKFNNNHYKKNLKRKFFDKWKVIKKFYNNFLLKIFEENLKSIEIIFNMNKKTNEFIFFIFLKSIKNLNENKLKNKCKNLLKIYSKNNFHNKNNLNNKILNVYLNKWKSFLNLNKILNSIKIIKKNFKIYLKNKENKKQKILLKILNNSKLKLLFYLKLWKLTNFKIKLHYKKFIKKSKKKLLNIKRKNSLILNINHLEKRKLFFLRKNFISYKIKIGLNYRKIFIKNVQIKFFHKNKKFISNKKYRMIKYIINKIENNEKIGNWNKLLKLKFNYWNNFDKFYNFRLLIFPFVYKKCEYHKNLKLLKLIKWLRLIKNEKIIKAILLIQKNFRLNKKQINNNKN